jgi:hypothetical protein
VRADLSRANLHMADLSYADVSGVDFTGAYMKSVLFWKTTAWVCQMRRITAKNALFLYSDLSGSDFNGAELLGAKFDGTLTYGCRNMDRAQYVWWYSPWGGPPSMNPRPGWPKMEESVLGSTSFQENSARTSTWK